MAVGQSNGVVLGRPHKEAVRRYGTGEGATGMRRSGSEEAGWLRDAARHRREATSGGNEIKGNDSSTYVCTRERKKRERERESEAKSYRHMGTINHQFLSAYNLQLTGVKGVHGHEGLGRVKRALVPVGPWLANDNYLTHVGYELDQRELVLSSSTSS